MSIKKVVANAYKDMLIKEDTKDEAFGIKPGYWIYKENDGLVEGPFYSLKELINKIDEMAKISNFYDIEEIKKVKVMKNGDIFAIDKFGNNIVKIDAISKENIKEDADGMSSGSIASVSVTSPESKEAVYVAFKDGKSKNFKTDAEMREFLSKNKEWTDAESNPEIDKIEKEPKKEIKENINMLSKFIKMYEDVKGDLIKDLEKKGTSKSELPKGVKKPKTVKEDVDENGNEIPSDEDMEMGDETEVNTDVETDTEGEEKLTLADYLQKAKDAIEAASIAQTEEETPEGEESEELDLEDEAEEENLDDMEEQLEEAIKIIKAKKAKVAKLKKKINESTNDIIFNSNKGPIVLKRNKMETDDTYETRKFINALNDKSMKKLNDLLNNPKHDFSPYTLIMNPYSGKLVDAYQFVKDFNITDALPIFKKRIQEDSKSYKK